MLQLVSISDFNLMSFPINMCSDNKDDVLSWEMVFYHVRSIHLHFHPFKVFKLSTQQGHSEYQGFFYSLNDFLTCWKMKNHLPLVASIYVWVMGTFQFILKE